MKIFLIVLASLITGLITIEFAMPLANYASQKTIISMETAKYERKRCLERMAYLDNPFTEENENDKICK